jgi:hypothetical protein
MLKDYFFYVCFYNEKENVNTLCDCYADLRVANKISSNMISDVNAKISREFNRFMEEYKNA